MSSQSRLGCFVTRVFVFLASPHRAYKLDLFSMLPMTMIDDEQVGQGDRGYCDFDILVQKVVQQIGMSVDSR